MLIRHFIQVIIGKTNRENLSSGEYMEDDVTIIMSATEQPTEEHAFYSNNPLAGLWDFAHPICMFYVQCLDPDPQGIF